MDDDVTNFFLWIIAVIVAIFNIILYCKVWRMTNHVKAMQETINRGRIRDAEIAYLTGNADIAQKILDTYLKATIEEEKEDIYFEEPKLRKIQILATYEYLGLSVPVEKEEINPQ